MIVGLERMVIWKQFGNTEMLGHMNVLYIFGQKATREPSLSERIALVVHDQGLRLERTRISS
jgi:hypothetical protein